MPKVFDKPLDVGRYPPVQFSYEKPTKAGYYWHDMLPLDEMGKNDFFYVEPEDVFGVRNAIKRYRSEQAPWALFTVRRMDEHTDWFVCRRMSG